MRELSDVVRLARDTFVLTQPQLGLVAATRSTACPNVFQVRRDPEYREGDELYYHATWKFGDEPAQPLHVDEIASRVDTVMRGIAASPAKFSSKALTISLTTNDPKFTSVVIIDLPGYFTSDRVGNDPAVVEGVRKVNHDVLSAMRPNDIMVLVIEATQQPSSFSLFSHPVDIRRYDPDMKRTRIVLTKADRLLTDETYPANASGGRAIRARIKEWSTVCHGRVPYWVVTHVVAPHEKQNMSFVDHMELVEAQTTEKQQRMDEAVAVREMNCCCGLGAGSLIECGLGRRRGRWNDRTSLSSRHSAATSYGACSLRSRKLAWMCTKS